MYLLQRSFKVGGDRYDMRLADAIVERERYHPTGKTFVVMYGRSNMEIG